MVLGPFVFCFVITLNRPDAQPEAATKQGLTPALAAGWPQPPQLPEEKSGLRFVFVERSVYFRTPVGVKKGKLNREGIFIPDESATEKLQGAMYPSVYGLAINDRFFPRDQDKPISNDATSEQVYEYRSGFLILGELMRDGYFVPKAGSSVVRFADYEPAPTATRIYNLPGEYKKTKPN